MKKFYHPSTKRPIWSNVQSGNGATIIQKIAQQIYARRRLIILITAVITLIFGYFTTRLQINPDITTYLPENERAVRLFNHIGEEYGGSLTALVVLETNDVFNRETIESIRLLTDEFMLIQGVGDVTSLTNILDIRSSEYGIELGRLIDEHNLPETEEEYRLLREYTLTKELFRGNIVAEDGAAALIICRLRHGADKIETAREIMAAVSSVDPREKVYFGGFPFLMLDISKTVINDLIMLTPMVGLIIVVILGIGFRSFRGVAVPVLTAMISTIWTMGLMGLTGVKLAIVSDIIPVILFAVGTAYSIHVMSRFNEQAGSELSVRLNAFTRVIIPVMLAAITTIFGFISFVFGSYLTMIREFGLFAGLGVFFSLVISLTFVPSLLFSMKDRPRRPAAGRRPLETGSILLNRPILVIAGAAMFLVTAIAGIPLIERKINMLDYFKPGTHIRKSEEIIKRKFGGSMPIQILAKGDIGDPNVLQSMNDLADYLKSHEDIKNTHSVVDLIMEMSFCIGEGRLIPDTKAKIDNLWFLLEGEETMNRLVNKQRDEAVIQSTLQSGLETHRVDELVTEINKYIEQHNTDHVFFEQTGMPTIHQQLDRSIKQSQMRSMIIAGILIFVVLFILLGSVLSALIGVVPIAFSLIMIFGFMGFFGIPLDIATVLVGSVCIGIGIDYSIHFLNRLKTEQQSCPSLKHAIVNTINTTGRAIFINMITVAGGFLILLFANLVPLQRFGALVAITMISSGVGTVVIIPAILIVSGAGKKNSKERKNEQVI